jgi:hypothetical protein
MVEPYPYNDDLLKSASDQQVAREQYGPIAFALIFPALLAHFAEADKVANTEKRRIRSRGLTSVGLVTVALLAASATAELHDEHLSAVIGFIAALLGIAGALIGYFNTPVKWLEHRLVTESLRQFHFRTLIRMAPDILAAAASGDSTAFERRRAGALAQFEQNVIKRKGALMDALIEAPETSKSDLIAPPPDPAVFAGENGALLLSAYRNLRILRQCQYADYKLSRGSGLFSAFPKRQANVLGLMGLAFVALLLISHVASAILSGSGILHLAAVWIALLALSLRVIEEGLKPRAEIERYRHYQAATYRILDMFEGGDTAGRVRAAEQLERASFDEMVIFLRSHEEARFTM